MDSTCRSCGRIAYWDTRFQSTSSRQKDPNKKPPRYGPITIYVHPYQTTSLGWEPGDHHARLGVLLPWVAQNDHSVTIVPPITMHYPVPSDPEHINTTAINIDALNEAWTTVTMPAEIWPNQCGSLRCKVDTGASGNVMPLCIFAKLFPRCNARDGKPFDSTHVTPHWLHTMDWTSHNLEP